MNENGGAAAKELLIPSVSPRLTAHQAAEPRKETFLPRALPLDERRVLCHADRLSQHFAATPLLVVTKVADGGIAAKTWFRRSVSPRLTAHRGAKPEEASASFTRLFLYSRVPLGRGKDRINNLRAF